MSPEITYALQQTRVFLTWEDFDNKLVSVGKRHKWMAAVQEYLDLHAKRTCHPLAQMTCDAIREYRACHPDEDIDFATVTNFDDKGLVMVITIGETSGLARSAMYQITGKVARKLG